MSNLEQRILDRYRYHRHAPRTADGLIAARIVRRRCHVWTSLRDAVREVIRAIEGTAWETQWSLWRDLPREVRRDIICSVASELAAGRDLYTYVTTGRVPAGEEDDS